MTPAEVRMFKLRRSIPALFLPVAMLPLTATAAEADPARFPIEVAATGTLLDPTLVRVPARITCAPMEVGMAQGGAQVKQASSGKIAFGSGAWESPIVCDGAPHTIDFLIWVDTASPAPFHRGSATVALNAFLCPPPPTSNDSCQSGYSGIRVIRLVK